MISQHSAFDLAKLRMQDRLAAADQRRLMAEMREQRGDRRFSGIRRQLGSLMVRAGERLQAVPAAERGALHTAR
ncbi:MAG TPA: hypothetical protein VFL82_12570 [Thermomicrobiales bacterium]|nr:hypothetical protein [Thermomicrobiales bacterium]